jgi:hypothetical protein
MIEGELWNVATRVAVDRLVVDRLANRRPCVCSLVTDSASPLNNSYSSKIASLMLAPDLLVRAICAPVRLHQ